MPFRHLFVLIALLAALTPLAGAQSGGSDAARTAARFEGMRAKPEALLAFLSDMPKGADLHDHADGAVYAEDMLAWAIADGACYTPATLALIEPCAGGDVPLAYGLGKDPNLSAEIVRALSMQTFASRTESGHDHFFNTFGKFGAVNARHPDRILAAATSDAARSRVQYLELMTAVDIGAARDAAKAVAVAHPFEPANFDADDAALDAAFAKIVPAAIAHARALEAERLAALRCASAQPDRGCLVMVRYIQSVIRVDDPASVFAQTRLAFALANDSRSGFVAINYVAPEDAPVAVRDYALHMRIIAYFHKKYPRAAIALHAGELTPAFVKPAALADHIRQAIEVAGATRIGHGVDVLGERDAAGLLREMASKHVLVEIALTSNDQILNVRGKAHPLPAYLAAGVPVALVTDDAGVSRSDLTHEFLRATLTYGFTYPQLKTFARNSVAYGFLPRTEKAAMERELERAFTAFEHEQALLQ
jgi:adenosine deaminase